MYENNMKQPTRGDHCLRYVAATSDDAPFLLNRLLFKVMSDAIYTATQRTSLLISTPKVILGSCLLNVNVHATTHYIK